MYVEEREKYRRVLARYARPDNPLMIPETCNGGDATAHEYDGSLCRFWLHWFYMLRRLLRVE